MFITNENIDNDTNINKAIRNLNIIEDFFLITYLINFLQNLMLDLIEKTNINIKITSIENKFLTSNSFLSKI